MSLSTQMVAATEGVAFVEFAALKIEFPDKTVRLLDGSDTVVLDGEVYTGSDDDYGVWTDAEDISDGRESEAPRFRFSLKVPAAAKAQVLIQLDRQMSVVTLTTGIVDQATGLALPGYEVEFLGYFDTARRRADVGSDVVDCDSFSIFEHFFEAMEGTRLTGSWLKSRYPGALGFDHVIDVDVALPWGTGGAGTAFKGPTAGDFTWWNRPLNLNPFDASKGGFWAPGIESQWL